jgi:hypothetical protein
MLAAVTSRRSRHVADPCDSTDEELPGYWADARTVANHRAGCGPLDLQPPARRRHTALAWDQKRRQPGPRCGRGRSRRGEPVEWALSLALRGPGFGTYLAQRAARRRLQPVSAGHPDTRVQCRLPHGPEAVTAAATYAQVRAEMSTSGPGSATMHRVFAGVAQQAEQPSCKQVGEPAVTWHLPTVGVKLCTYSACPSSCLRISSQPLLSLGAPCALSACGGRPGHPLAANPGLTARPARQALPAPR